MHLTYDFDKLAEENAWSDTEKALKFSRLLAYIRKEVTERFIRYDDDGNIVSGNKAETIGKIYAEVFGNSVINIRRLTHLTEDEQDEIARGCDKAIDSETTLAPAMPAIPKITNQPCNRCGKRPHADCDGICLDCADELGVSDLFVSSPEYKENLEKAKTYLDSYRNKIGSAGFRVG